MSLSSATLSDLNQVLQVMEETRAMIADTFSEEEQVSVRMKWSVLYIYNVLYTITFGAWENL